jgi:mannosyltransferase
MSGNFSLRFGGHSIASSRQLEVGLLAGIVLIAAALRFYKLGDWSFWIDEIFTINRAQAHVNIQTILDYWWQPSTSTIITGFTLRHFGVSELTSRLPTAVVGVISIPVVYLLLKRVLGSGVAMLSAFLLATAPWHLYWSQNARYLVMLLVFYISASFAFFWAIENDRPRYLLVFVLFLFLALGERLTAAFLVPVIAIYLVALWLLPIPKPPGFRQRNLLLLIVPLVGAMLFDLFRFLATGASSLHSTFATFAFMPTRSNFRLLPLLTFEIGVPVVVFAFFGGIYLVLQKERAGLYLLVNAVVPFMILLMISPFFFTVDRYVFMTLPFWVSLAALAGKRLLSITEGASRLLAAAVVVVFIVDALGSLLMYYQINHGNRPDARRLIAHVQEQRREDDVIVSSVPALVTYYTSIPVDSLNSIDLAELEAPERRYWIIVESEVGSPLEMRQWLEKNAELVDIDYLRARNESYTAVYLVTP